MSLPYFFADDLNARGNIVLPPETSKHCLQTLRMKVGEKLNLTDGRGNLFTTSITSTDRKICMVTIEEKNHQPQNLKKISIAISLLKNSNRFEWFLEKATEIGVSEIIPLICKRTERQHFRFERMKNIVVSAMLQSQQTWLPFLHEPQTFENIVTSSPYNQKLIANCHHSEKQLIGTAAHENSTQILIGPEGDFTIEEIELALQNNYKEVLLGNTRLRSETAGVVAAALLINHKG